MQQVSQIVAVHGRGVQLSCPAKEARAPPPLRPAKYLGLVLGTCIRDLLAPRSMDPGTRRALSFSVGCSLPLRLPPWRRRRPNGKSLIPQKYCSRRRKFYIMVILDINQNCLCFAVVDVRTGGKGRPDYIYHFSS